MKRFRVHLSSGQFITVRCKAVELGRDETGKYNYYYFKDLEHTKFLSFSIPDIVAVEEI